MEELVLDSGLELLFLLSKAFVLVCFDIQDFKRLCPEVLLFKVFKGLFGKSNLRTFMPPLLDNVIRLSAVEKGAYFPTKERTALFQMNLTPLFRNDVAVRRRVLLM